MSGKKIHCKELEKEMTKTVSTTEKRKVSRGSTWEKLLENFQDDVKGTPRWELFSESRQGKKTLEHHQGNTIRH